MLDPRVFRPSSCNLLKDVQTRIWKYSVCPVPAIKTVLGEHIVEHSADDATSLVEPCEVRNPCRNFKQSAESRAAWTVQMLLDHTSSNPTSG